MSAAILNVTAIDTNHIEIWEINKSYPVIYASRIVRGTIFTLLLAILKDINHVKIYMPEVNHSDLQNHLIIAYYYTRSEK